MKEVINNFLSINLMKNKMNKLNIKIKQVLLKELNTKQQNKKKKEY